MIGAIGVGGPRPPIPPSWDLALPVYLLLSLLLAATVTRLRLSLRVVLGCLVAAIVWDRLGRALGLVPAAAIAVLVAAAARPLLRAIGRSGPRA